MTPNNEQIIEIISEIRDRIIRVEAGLEGLKESVLRDKVRTESVEKSLHEIEKDVHALKLAEGEKRELWSELKTLKDRVDSLATKAAIVWSIGGFLTALVVALSAALFRKYL